MRAGTGTRWAAAVAATLGSAAALAQTEQQVAERPDPVEILRGADAKVSAAREVSFRVERRGVGSRALGTPTVDAHVVMQRAREGDQLGWLFAIDGTVTPIEATERWPLISKYDGTKVRMLSASESKVLEARTAVSDGLMDRGPGAAVAWLLHWNLLVTESVAEDGGDALLSYAGRATVGGIPCHVVYVDYSGVYGVREMDAWWYIDQQTSLPRRVDSHYFDNARGDGFEVTIITDLDLSPSVADGAFVLAVPTGFTAATMEDVKPTEVIAVRPPARSGEGDLAPDFTLRDPTGTEHMLSQYRGRVVVLDFWATWCHPCKLAMPALQAVHEKYKDRGVTIFGVSCWESGEPSRYMESQGFTYTLLLDGDPVASRYGVSAIPAIFVIGPDGRVAHFKTGYSPDLERQLSDVIDALLGG